MDGIVVPLGKTMNSDRDVDDCCNFVRPHAHIIALADENSTTARVAFVKGGNVAVAGRVLSELWHTLPVPCTSVNNANTLDISMPDDTNEYLCSLVSVHHDDNNTSNSAPKVLVFDKVYMKTRGWLMVSFSRHSHVCTISTTIPCGPFETNIAYDWEVQHVRTVSNVQEAANNYNIPNDAYMWQLDDHLFGGVDGVGKSAQRCPSSAEYDNIQGTIKWKPRIPQKNTTSFWLYTVFSVGESLACKFHNCDESGFFKLHAAKYVDDIPNPDGHHPITFFEGTSITAFVPHTRSIVLPDGCIVLESDAFEYNPNTSTNMWTFHTTAFLFGDVQVEEFAVCTSCSDSDCDSEVIPCRWFSSTDSTWWYSMYIYFSNGDFTMFTFALKTSDVQNSTSTNMTEYEGYAISPAESDPFLKIVTATNSENTTIFTTPNRKCAANTHHTSRMDNIETRKVQARNKHMKIRTRHNRKLHVRSYTIPIATKRHTAVFASNIATQNIHADPAQKTTGVSQKGSSGASRFMLSLDASVSRATDKPEQILVENTTQHNAVTRRITSIDNNEKVVEVVCASKKDSAVSCDMLVIEKEVQINTFCQQENAFMWSEGSKIRTHMLNASSTFVSDIIITSIARAQYARKCAYTATRRLLQTEIVHITCVIMIAGRSFIDRDVLVSNGFSGLRRITTTQLSNFSICSASQHHTSLDDNDCVHFHAQSDANSSHTSIVQSTMPRFNYPTTTPQNALENNTNTTFLNQQTTVGKKSVQPHIIGILTGIGVLILIVFGMLAYQYNCTIFDRSANTQMYTGVTQSDPNIFFHHGQLVYPTYYAD